MDKSGDNTKVCATDIKIGARLSIAGLVKMAIDFTMSKVKKRQDQTSDTVLHLLQGIMEPHLLQGIKEPHLLVILLV